MATINTLRVYIGAYFDTTVSVLVFLSVAVSTSDNILLTVEFLYMEVTFTSIKPLLLILPDNTSLPMVAFNNSDSPVRRCTVRCAGCRRAYSPWATAQNVCGR